jgi:hypothetical protein
MALYEIVREKTTEIIQVKIFIMKTGAASTHPL